MQLYIIYWSAFCCWARAESQFLPSIIGKTLRIEMQKKNFRKRSIEDDQAKDNNNSEDEEERRLVLISFTSSLFWLFCSNYSESESKSRLALEEVKFLQKQRERKLGIPAIPTLQTTGVTPTKKVAEKNEVPDGDKEELVLQDTFAQETAVMVEDPNMYVYLRSQPFCFTSTHRKPNLKHLFLWNSMRWE